MNYARHFGIMGVLLVAAIATGPSVATAEHAKNKGGAKHLKPGLKEAAYEFAAAAEYFHQFIHDKTGYSHLGDKAHRIADWAFEVKRSLKYGASLWHIRKDLDRISYAIRHLDRELKTCSYGGHGDHYLNDLFGVCFPRHVYSVRTL